MLLGIQIIFLLVFPLILTMLATPLVVKISGNYGFLDIPESRKIHSMPTPRLGGVAMMLGFFATMTSVALFIDIAGGLFVIMVASIMLFLMGMWDDLKPLSALHRLCFQTACATVTVYSCGLSLESITLTSGITIEIHKSMGMVISTFIVIGAMNAINMVDGLDGLAGGLVLICLSFLGMISLLTTGSYIILLFIVLPVIGVILGFLRYNTHPAKIFMGDGGSNWLGFISGITILIVMNRMAISQLPGGQWGIIKSTNNFANSTSPWLIEGIPGSALPIVSILMCMAIPIIDTATVIAIRIKTGKSPFLPDRQHFHHSLLRIGLTQSQCVGAIYFIAISIGILSIAPIIFPRYGFEVIPYISLALVLTCFATIRRLNDNSVKTLISEWKYFESSVPIGHKLKRTVRTLETLNRYIIYVIFMGVPLFSGAVDINIGYSALCCLSLLSISKFFKVPADDFLNTLIFTISIVVLLISNNKYPILVAINSETVSLNGVYNILFGWLAFASLVILVLTFRRRYLIFSPSDFLMITFPLGIFLIPQPLRGEYFLDSVALKSLVLFVAIHLLTRRRKVVATQIKAVLVNALILVAAMGLLGLRVIG